ncbi:MSHA biogenesis protein MshK [Photobacterium sp. GB-72]|uniref:MSHA biogenesis protein MshK n=1 Tax=Photobacterium sp. GB-72 TaxID=2022105 RepID=UPI000D17C5AC|nr:MSHA biogenesis protein MshK [Photobacterium sp. GB-72]PSV31645.1 MSHA biogenesis protein MshK [Photobacterium sp. GB-72]
MDKKMTWMAALLLSLCAFGAYAAQDPTAPLGWVASKAKTNQAQARLPQLQSIICDGQQCSVILSGQVVSLGERVNDYTLTNVSESSVTLSRSGKKWHLALFAENIRTN